MCVFEPLKAAIGLGAPSRHSSAPESDPRNQLQLLVTYAQNNIALALRVLREKLPSMLPPCDQAFLERD